MRQHCPVNAPARSAFWRVSINGIQCIRFAYLRTRRGGDSSVSTKSADAIKFFD
jgi:hypothetical protein